MSDHGFKNLAEWAEAIRKESETGIKDPRLTDKIKLENLSIEDIIQLESWSINVFPEPCTCGHDLIEHDDPDYTGMLFCRFEKCTCTNFEPKNGYL